ncbi:MAG: Translation initiation factor IF-2 [Parcubacteria group bacterium GW2011_GWA2_50_10]|nr:MAG: Translation initiation factor IF-2 [Parcubacteria group bacterium GW2011_GWA2_50_10]
MVTLDPAARVVNIIVKADVAGSLEALEEVLRNIPQEGSVLRVMHYGVGEVQESNIKLARSASAHIFSFRTKASAAALDLAEKEGVSIQQFDIIYELIQAVRELLETSAKKEEGRKEVGSLLVLAVFLTDKKRQVVGGKVLEGEVRKGVMVEVMREGEIVGQGEIANVQRDKKNVSLVGKGQECGLAYEGAVSIQRGDRLQFFTG